VKRLFHKFLSLLGLRRHDPPVLRLIGGSVERKRKSPPIVAGGPGVMVGPGEVAEFQLELPPEILARVDRGAKLEMRQGPTRQVAHNHYESEIEILLDGEVTGTSVIAWKGEDD